MDSFTNTKCYCDEVPSFVDDGKEEENANEDNEDDEYYPVKWIGDEEYRVRNQEETEDESSESFSDEGSFNRFTTNLFRFRRR